MELEKEKITDNNPTPYTNNWQFSDRLSQSIQYVRTNYLESICKELSLPFLMRLCDLEHIRLSLSVNTPITTEQFEMLEAELINQGIISKQLMNGTTLTSHLYHEISVLRWRAQRYGISALDLEFEVNVPQFITKRAKEISEKLNSISKEDASKFLLTWTTPNESREQLTNELKFLNQFAAYLLGTYENPSNRYARGLNVVLKALSNKRNESTNKTTILTLPINKRDFFISLRQCSK